MPPQISAFIRKWMREVGLVLSDSGAHGHPGKLSLVVLPSFNDQHRNKGRQIQTVSLGRTLNHFAFLDYGTSKEKPNKPGSTSPSNQKSPSGFGVLIVLFSLQCTETCYPLQLLPEIVFPWNCILGMTALVQES